MPQAHLGYCQGDSSTMADAMKGHLPGAHRDVLEAIPQSITPCIRGAGGIARSQLEGFKLRRQG